MQPYYDKNDITIYHGDLLDVLPTLPEASVDFVVTDPPYGLSFMDKGWDHGVPGCVYWQAVARVGKPGALMLAFGGTRTYHRLTCAIEEAGWEIRDCLMWLRGQGFPKAADVGKMIDKAKGAVREVVGTKLGQPGYSLADNGRTNEVYGDLHDPEAECAITAPATPLAAKWTGWANALKPAWEPIVLAMKPLDGTLAHNAEKWGMAGMNIDAGRIGDNPGYRYNADHNGTTFHGKQGERIKQSAEKKGSQFIESIKGRWPANLLLDKDAAAQLDDQTGILSVTGKQSECSRNAIVGGTAWGTSNHKSREYPGDFGGASRFFYCGKATKKERGAGNDHPTVKPLALMKYLLMLLSTPDGGVVLDPFAGSGTTALAAKQLGRRCIAVELDERYCEIAVSRLSTVPTCGIR